MLIFIWGCRASTSHPARNRVHGCLEASKIARGVYAPVRDNIVCSARKRVVWLYVLQDVILETGQ